MCGTCVHKLRRGRVLGWVPAVWSRGGLWRSGYQKQGYDKGREGCQAPRASGGLGANLTRAPWGREDLRLQGDLIYSEQRRRGQSTHVESKGTRQGSGSLHWLFLLLVVEFWPNVSSPASALGLSFSSVQNPVFGPHKIFHLFSALTLYF